MKRTPLRRRTKLRVKTPLRRNKLLQRRPSMAATERQRAAVAGLRCIVCGSDGDPAHLIPRSLAGAAIRLGFPLCRFHHGAYDRGELDLLAYPEPEWRAQVANAVGHIGC